jgi:sulfur-carrier protein adenylyltransferase/sulfurtransferase
MPINSVNQLQATELKKKIDNGEDVFLLDVREPWEFSLAAIEGSENFPLAEVIDRQQEFFFEEEIVVICHYGERSQRAANELIKCEFKMVHNLVGGIDAWSQIIDPKVPRYRPSG